MGLLTSPLTAKEAWGAVGGAIVDHLYSLVFAIDRGVYWMAKIAYDVFMFIADARILKDSTAFNLINRIYALIGIFMLFVLAYNLLTYIIDPDKMVDKEKGMSSIIKNVVIALVVMTLLPTLFSRLYSLQSTVLKSGVIENLVLSGYSSMSKDELEQNGGTDAKSSIENGVNIMVANTYAAFLLPDSGNATVVDCMYENSSVPQDYCEAYQNVRKTGDIMYYRNFIGNSDYRYYPLITTVTGVVLIFFTLSFCLTLATRAGKLAILQLIAPIPLFLELVPKYKGARKRWVDSLLETYVQVFIYLAMIYLVIFLISLIPDVVIGLKDATLDQLNPELSKEGVAGTVTQLVAIVIFSYGLLQFGKTAPDFIYKVLGIENKGTLLAAAKRAKSYFTASVGGGIGRVGYDINNFKQGWADFKSAGSAREKAKVLGKTAFNTGFGANFAMYKGMANNKDGKIRGMVSGGREAISQSRTTTNRTRRNVWDAGSTYMNGGSLGEAVAAARGMPKADKLATALSSFSGKFEDFGKKDSGYLEQDEYFNKYKAAAAKRGINWDAEYQAWRAARGGRGSEADFASDILANNLFGGRLNNAAQAYQAKEATRLSINNKNSNRDKYRNAAIDLIATIEGSGINLNDPQFSNIRTELNTLKGYFKNGDIRTGELASNNILGSEILRTMNNLDREISTKRRDIEAKTLSRKAREKAEDNKNK